MKAGRKTIPPPLSPAPIFVQNRQRGVRVSLGWLRALSRLAWQACVPETGPGEALLATLPEIEVAVVSDKVIAQVHLDFMGLPDPTDVITFSHGEIVASAETARRCAGEFGHSTDEEIALYIVHGLLHLNGFDDLSPRDAARMRKAQDRIWKWCRAQLPPPAV